MIIKPRHRSQTFHPGGFTLIEVIITLLVAAVLAAMLVSYFGTAITGSAAPVTNLGTALNAQTLLEIITSDYVTNYTSDLPTLKGKITNKVYGSYTIVDNTYITWSNNADVSSVATTKCLKVTIKDNTGETLTQVYTDKNLLSSYCQ